MAGDQMAERSPAKIDVSMMVAFVFGLPTRLMAQPLMQLRNFLRMNGEPFSSLASWINNGLQTKY